MDDNEIRIIELEAEVKSLKYSLNQALKQLGGKTISQPKPKKEQEPEPEIEQESNATSMIDEVRQEISTEIRNGL